MHRYLLSTFAFLIALLTVQPAAAGGPNAREVERMAAKFERLFQSLTDAGVRQELEFTRLGDGIYSLRLAMASADQARVQIRDDEDGKPLRLLAAGHMASEPTTPSVAVNAIVSSPESPYNIWWVVVNQGSEVESKRTMIKITGPEEFVFEVSDRVDYEPNTVTLVWFNPELLFEAGGIYTHRTTVRSAGKNLYKFWVE